MASLGLIPRRASVARWVLGAIVVVGVGLLCVWGVLPWRTGWYAVPIKASDVATIEIRLIDWGPETSRRTLCLTGDRRH